jgi:ribonuclease Z
MGVISTLHLQGRTEDLHLYSPPELKEIIEVQLKHSQTDLRYKLIYHFIDPINPAKLFEDADVEVSTIILNHRIPCTGFLFKEKPRLRKLKKEAISMYKIPVSAFEKIKAGEDYKNENGEHIPNSLITALPKTPRSYAFCSDTVYDERIASFIQGIDLLYHEATFANDKAGRAIETFHCTAEQAATIAKISRVRRLIIGHFSARYKNLYPLLEEAKLVFQNTSLAQEGDRFKIDYKEDNG